MSTFVFAVLPAIGHLNPMLSIAEQLKKAGHRVIFICFAPEVIADHVEAHDFRLEGIPGIDPSYFKLVELLMVLPTGFFETVNGLKTMFGRLAFVARKTHNVLERIQPDMVVADFTFPGACLAAEMLEIPTTVIYHAGLCFPGPGIPPFGSGLPIQENWGWRGRLYSRLHGLLERNLECIVDHARRRLGLPRTSLPVFTQSRFLTLVLTSEGIEAPRGPLPPTAYYVGPCLAGRRRLPGDEDVPIHRFSGSGPIVFVTLGTVFNRRPKLFLKIIDALSDTSFRVIVKAGGAYRTLRALLVDRMDENVHLFENVSQMEVLPHADLVICHGGNNTVNESLAAGKPLLVIPIGGEQGDNAAKVVWLGVGLRADLKRSDPLEIREKVMMILQEEHFRRNALDKANVLKRTNGAATAARFILHVVESGEPLIRPRDYPLTVTGDREVPWEYGKKR